MIHYYGLPIYADVAIIARGRFAKMGGAFLVYNFLHMYNDTNDWELHRQYMR